MSDFEVTQPVADPSAEAPTEAPESAEQAFEESPAPEVVEEAPVPSEPSEEAVAYVTPLIPSATEVGQVDQKTGHEVLPAWAVKPDAARLQPTE